MFKPVQGAAGELAQVASTADLVIYVNSDLASKITTALAGVHHTYIVVSEVGVVEAMKVTSADLFGLVVERAKDGTTAKTFNAGATVEYALTSDAVLDIVNERLAEIGVEDTLTFSINLPHAVERTGDNVDITIQPMTLTSPNSTIDITGSGFDIGLDVERGAFGCCDD
jgi:urease gamma subunit